MRSRFLIPEQYENTKQDFDRYLSDTSLDCFRTNQKDQLKMKSECYDKLVKSIFNKNKRKDK